MNSDTATLGSSKCGMKMTAMTQKQEEGNIGAVAAADNHRGR